MALTFEILEADAETGDLSSWLGVTLEKQPNELYSIVIHEFDVNHVEAEYDDEGFQIDMKAPVLETYTFSGRITRKTKALVELKDEEGNEVLSLFGGPMLHASTLVGSGQVEDAGVVRRWFQ